MITHDRNSSYNPIKQALKISVKKSAFVFYS